MRQLGVAAVLLSIATGSGFPGVLVIECEPCESHLPLPNHLTRVSSIVIQLLNATPTR
jgi:hypothetical protein